MKWKKKMIVTVISIILFTAGIIVMLYPYICQYLYQRQADRIINEFDQRISDQQISDQRIEEDTDNWDWLYMLMEAYNKKLYEEKQKNLVDPFSYSQPDFSLMEFGFDEEMIGYLSIPKMDIRLPVYLGANQENMKKGAAHLTQTSLPVGGVNTNAVISAHRGMSTAVMFRDIEKLEMGDEVTITNFRETLHYRVAEIKIINPTDIGEILIQPGRDLVTLTTCHPYRHNYQRYVVYCERVIDK